jgi:hypothetical protein
MAGIDVQKILNNEARIIVLANQIAGILNKAGVAERHGTFIDRRCAEIKEIAHAMSVEAKASIH